MASSSLEDSSTNGTPNDDYFNGPPSEREGLISSTNSPPNERDVDARTPLDRTIDMIGMGTYQWALLALCGLGWLADNMWVQAVAIILPRVQDHYSVPDSRIGLVSSSVFAGMMFGAVGWGSCSDLVGRSIAFNGTLFFTAVFGLSASFTNSFPALCFVLFLLGSSVGGSMPTDGTLLLEHMPKSQQHLLTFMSVFFSIGAVVPCLIALAVVPDNSCRECENVDEGNKGWKTLLWSLGLITLAMFVARIALFRLHESPRYLVHAGRPEDAIKSLENISKYNGEDLSLELDDVVDHHETKDIEDGIGHVVFDASTSSQSFTSQIDPSSPSSPDSHRTPTSPTPRPLSPRRRASSSRSRTILKSLTRWLPTFIRRPIVSWIVRIAEVLSPEWRRTTMIVWGIWGSMSLAYTIFNVFLPKLLESEDQGIRGPNEIRKSLWDMVIFTLGGVPGPIIGAYMVDNPRIGKRLSLAGSTFVTALFSVVFIWTQTSVPTSTSPQLQPRAADSDSVNWGSRMSSIVISLSSGGMWAILYGWTPDIFETRIRGSACGIASALSRIGGMLAPLIGGIMLMLSRSLPVYTSAIVYGVCGSLVLLLKESEGKIDNGSRGWTSH